VKDSQEDSLVLAIVRGEMAVIFFELFEGRAFSHGTRAQCISCEKFMSSIVDK